MFNRLYQILKNYIVSVLILSLFFTCGEEIYVDFLEEQITTSEAAEISINFPKAKGNAVVSEAINNTIKNHIVNQTNLSEDSLTNISIADAVDRFNTEFKNFKTNFPDSAQKWEAFIDGEVTYRSADVICIAINSYLDTGGAHGNTNVKFFNFNPQTGELYSKQELIDNFEGLSVLIENKLHENLKSNSGDVTEDFFFGKNFQLPESIGYSDEGLIILYNPYEIASYSQGIIEFTIPYNEVDAFMSIY
jgi:hypothetical protein